MKQIWQRQNMTSNSELFNTIVSKFKKIIKKKFFSEAYGIFSKNLIKNLKYWSFF